MSLLSGLVIKFQRRPWKHDFLQTHLEFHPSLRHICSQGWVAFSFALRDAIFRTRLAPTVSNPPSQKSPWAYCFLVSPLNSRTDHENAIVLIRIGIDSSLRRIDSYYFLPTGVIIELQNHHDNRIVSKPHSELCPSLRLILFITLFALARWLSSCTVLDKCTYLRTWEKLSSRLRTIS